MPSSKPRYSFAIRSDLSGSLSKGAEELQMTPNHLANLLIEGLLKMMVAEVPEIPQVVSNYRRMTGRDLVFVPELMWELLARAMPALNRSPRTTSKKRILSSSNFGIESGGVKLRGRLLHSGV